MNKYEDAIAELQKLLIDAKKNRHTEDPEMKSEKWSGFIQGIENAIYRLEMKSV